MCYIMLCMCLLQNLLANHAAALQQIASSESTFYQIQRPPSDIRAHHVIAALCAIFSLPLPPFPADPEQFLVGLQGVPDEETMMNLAIALSLQEEVYTTKARSSLSYMFPMNL